jgi:hypothetical protein
MVFLVFVGFYLVTDHAPWWVWLLLAAAYVIDEARESRAALVAARNHSALMTKLQTACWLLDRKASCLPRSR